jgi:hypothetical protein
MEQVIILGDVDFATLVDESPEEFSGDSMPWTKPLHGRGRIDLAGDVMSGRKALVLDMDLNNALDIAGNWRSSHGYPLSIIFQSLRRRAKKIDVRALVASRSKRLPSVSVKLKRFPNMKLSQMQDLGGCRAVLRNVKRVYRLVEYYNANPYRAIEFLKPKDYIKEPKPDGYRSVHLICRYQGTHQNGAYKGLRIEIQIRSAMQHAWATAVETIDAFTGQAIKTNIAGDVMWRRFFSLMGSAIAIMEKQPLVPGTPEDTDDLSAELRKVCGQLNIPNVFYGLSAGMSLTQIAKSKAGIYILTLDSEKRRTSWIGFPTVKTADEHYLEMEKENKNKTHIQTVMVKLDSIRELKRAYPGYYSDTRRFIQLVEAFCHQSR